MTDETINGKAIVEVAEAMARDVNYLIKSIISSEPGPDSLQIGIFLTIAEQLVASLHLVRAGLSSHAALHVRSMLEGLVTMRLIGKNSKYVDQIKYNYFRGEKKVYEGMLENESHYGDYKEEIEARLKECKPYFDSLHSAGLRPQKITDAFIAADLTHLMMPYAVLCRFSHNDISVITMRHHDDDSMKYLAPTSPELSTSIFYAALVTVMSATASLEKIAKFPNGVFESIFQNMNNRWVNYQDSVSKNKFD